MRSSTDDEQPAWLTQGGGLAVTDATGTCVFVEAPACPGFNVGDAVPSDWGLAPANDAAYRAMEATDGDPR